MFPNVSYWNRATPLLLLVLSACASTSESGEGDGGGVGAPPVIDTVTALTFANAGNDLMGITLHTVFSNQSFATPNPFALPNLAAAPVRVASACVPVTTGVDTSGLAIDSDGDGTPDDFTVDYGAGCTEIDSSGSALTFSGRYELKDTGHGILDYAYVPNELAAMVRDTATGHFFRQSVTAVETAHFIPDHATHQLDVTREVTFWEGADTVQVLVHTLAGSTFDPAPGAEFVRHGRLPEGTLHFGAEITFQDFSVAGEPIRFVYSTPTPIHLSHACPTGIDAGELFGAFRGDSRVGIRFTWDGCVPGTLHLFGITGGS